MGFKYRADHVGSFLRPPEILDARAAGASAGDLRSLEEKHIRRFLDKQQDLGFKIFTDGEVSRRTFMSDFNEATSGWDEEQGINRMWAAAVPPTPPACTSPASSRSGSSKPSA